MVNDGVIPHHIEALAVVEAGGAAGAELLRQVRLPGPFLKAQFKFTVKLLASRGKMRARAGSDHKSSKAVRSAYEERIVVVLIPRTHSEDAPDLP
jgi:hypothetical protein